MQYRGLVTGLLVTALCMSATPAVAQRCKEYKPATAPTSSFKIDLKRNVVSKGGLMWKRCAEGQAISKGGCEGKADQIYFDDAMNNKKYKRFAGYSNWRLPTIDEVKGILEKRCKKPSFNLTVFPGAPNFKIWSQSRVENSDDKIWIMFSSTGVAIKHRIEQAAMLRLVRDIQ